MPGMRCTKLWWKSFHKCEHLSQLGGRAWQPLHFGLNASWMEPMVPGDSVSTLEIKSHGETLVDDEHLEQGCAASH